MQLSNFPLDVKTPGFLLDFHTLLKYFLRAYSVVGQCSGLGVYTSVNKRVGGKTSKKQCIINSISHRDTCNVKNQEGKEAVGKFPVLNSNPGKLH